MERRSFIFNAAGAFVCLGSTVSAQSIADAVAVFKLSVPSVFASNARLSADPEFVESFLEQEKPARQAFFRAIAFVPIEILGRDFDPAFEPFQVALSGSLEDMKIRPEEVEGLKVRADIQPRQGDTRVSVVLDVFCESMGLQVFREAFIDLADSDTVFGENFRELSRQIGVNDYSNAFDIISLMIAWMTTDQGIRALRLRMKGMTGAQIKRRLAVSLGSRMVPFVGWAFTIGSLSACVYAHRKRLLAVL
jgi:hypothetical protein